jgi:hypothetical protein
MTDPTPADTLRAAAEKLRALAAAATEDSGSTTWHAARHFPEQPDSTFTALWATGVRPLLGGGGGRGRPPAYVHAPVGDYIALMDPGLSHALADWLDETATEVTAAEGTEYELLAHEPSNSWTAALAVARQILGDKP